MIVDTAVHYVEPPSAERPYDSTGTVPPEFLSVEKAIADATAAGIDRIVQMAPSAIGFDNRYNLEGVQRYPDRVAGVFGRFDPMAPNVAERLAELAAQPGLLGTRVLLHKGAASGSWLRDGSLDPFLQAAQKIGVAVSLYPAEPAALREIVRRYPGIRFLAEHSTLNKDRPEPFALWTDVLSLSTEPNVWMQVSYFPEVAPKGERFPFPSVRERLRELYERAGGSRLVFGAHYPRIKEYCTYREALDFVAKADFITPADLPGILGENFMTAFVAARAKA